MFHQKTSRTAIIISLCALILSGCQSNNQEVATDAGPAPVEEAKSGTFSNLSELDKAHLNRLIKDYILANPSIVNQALQISRARQEIRSDQSEAQLFNAHAEGLFNDPNSYSVGPDDADVTIVEFFDYRCGFCKKAHPVVTNLMASDPNIKLIYKEYPILGQVSLLASQAAMASKRQGKYETFHKNIYQNRGSLTMDRIYAIAAESGLDVEQLKTDMQDPAINDAILKNKELGKSLKINGTPTFVVGNRIIKGFVSLDNLQRQIAAVRAEQEVEAARAKLDKK